MEEENLVYYSNVPGLVSSFNVTYDNDELWLSIDSWKRRFKTDRLHLGSQYASVPVGYWVHLKECSEISLASQQNKIYRSLLDHLW